MIGTAGIRLFDQSGTVVASGGGTDVVLAWQNHSGYVSVLEVVPAVDGTVVLTPGSRHVDAYVTRGLPDGADCVELDAQPDRVIETCRDPGYHSSEFGRDLVYVGPDGRRRVLVGAVYPEGLYPGTDTPVAGHWSSAVLSPDGRWVAAQWSGECEVPTAFLVRVADGAVFGPTGAPLANTPDDWASSTVIGWAGDRALVAMSAGACGSAPRNVVMAVDPDPQATTDLTTLSLDENGSGDWVVPWRRQAP